MEKDNVRVTSPPPPYSDNAPSAPPKNSEDFHFAVPQKEGGVDQLRSPAFSPVSAQSQQGFMSKTPPTTPHAFDFANNAANNQIGNLQNDIFKRPPKFLLYPSVSQNEEEPKSKFTEVSPELPRPIREIAHQPIPIVHHPNQQAAQPIFAPVGPNPGMMQMQPQFEPPLALTHGRDGFMPRQPHRVICPQCNIPVLSQVDYVSGTMTHLAAFACCWIGCCFCIPYLVDDLKDVEHYCPNCTTVIGYHHRRICN